EGYGSPGTILIPSPIHPRKPAARTDGVDDSAQMRDPPLSAPLHVLPPHSTSTADLRQPHAPPLHCFNNVLRCTCPD
ncbi:MAG: hypothetical protein KDK23_16480, partial [Leptospiraceae bacterium]|nr:hypothetical protein [Leptospiraceae bacterium]